MHLQFQRDETYVALEEVENHDFFWSKTEINKFQRLWKKDVPLVEIAETLGRSELACMFLALDRMMKGKLTPRAGWRIW